MTRYKFKHQAARVTLAAAFALLATSGANAGQISMAFSGDALAALKALKLLDPQLQVMPPLGRPTPVPVAVNVQGGTTTDALRAIGEQGGSAVDVVYSNESHQVRLVYNSSAAIPMQTIPQSAIDAASKPLNTKGIKEADGTIRFPYGYGTPTVVCAPLAACDIALEPGEIIKTAKAGDTERWLITHAETGEGDQAVRHIVIKPKMEKLSTDLKIYTNRRLYSIKIESAQSEYMSSVGFYYPNDAAANWATATNANMAKAAKEDERTIVDMPGVQPDKLNLNYTIKGDKGLPWFPVRAFDEGTHVFIEMPASAGVTELPVMMVQGADGLQMVNFRIPPRKKQDANFFIIVDKLFDHGVLILGSGSDQQKVDIYKGQSRGWFSWATGDAN
ncbi:P-type conjugative transfer protein TrbG [Pandoraea cepalis]|uniref:P-type conjugative transfer protein TrbG n=1 Tax=Pandoraea cepalis TaxID=2508294 RepID=A0AAW7MH37_9BURK|nr:P-type conjugative transfer protein TrbG [Pandoraea cepalis]MDN4572043.1 P-type conjugative transfer protein TrbG [Pandoraea cepalis]MDN4578889.1 P-type conjugative transfer protein TrbG [Pandoraea cepalis]